MIVTMPPLHPGQREIHNSPARFRVAACGRRWGKTREAAAEGFAAMLAGQRAWWVAPTYKVCQYGWRAANALARQVPMVAAHTSEMRLRYGKGELTFRSADQPDNLRGEGLDLLIMDEAAFLGENIWAQILRPSLIDRQGRALFISTPNGKNWFYNLFLRGQGGGEWEAWQRPSFDNPYLPPSELESLKAELPERKYAQEICADFTDFEGRVFPDAVYAPVISEPDGAPVVFGIDVGRSPDATSVAVAYAGKPRVLTVEETHRDYAQQLDWLAGLVVKWKPTLIVIEENGVGAPICDGLARRAERVIPFQTTNKSKTELVDQLIVRMEQDHFALPDIPSLRAQFENYACKKTALGAYSFGAPEGMHDDGVQSVMLAQWAQQLASLPTRAFRI